MNREQKLQLLDKLITELNNELDLDSSFDEFDLKIIHQLTNCMVAHKYLSTIDFHQEMPEMPMQINNRILNMFENMCNSTRPPT